MVLDCDDVDVQWKSEMYIAATNEITDSEQLGVHMCL